MANPKSDEFPTGDLYFAAYLKTAKVPWLGCRPDTRDGRKGRMVFVFERTSEIKSLQHAFFARSPKGKVVALNYANEVQALKAMTRIHD
jgi:hypothetical protein